MLLLVNRDVKIKVGQVTYVHILTNLKVAIKKKKVFIFLVGGDEMYFNAFKV